MTEYIPDNGMILDGSPKTVACFASWSTVSWLLIPE